MVRNVDMKKICLFLIIILLLVPVSSFASHVPSWPPPGTNIPPNVELYEYVYVFFLSAADDVYHILSSDVPMMVWDEEGISKRDAIFVDESNSGRYIHHAYVANTDKWLVGNPLYIEDVYGSYRIYYPDYNSQNILYANSNIYRCKRYYDDELGKYIYYHEGDLYGRNTLIDFWADVNFVTPPSGVHDTLSEMLFTVNTEFNRLLTSDEIKSIEYKFYVNGEKKNILKKLNEAFLPLSVNDCTTHILSFEILVPVGENLCEIIYYNDEGFEIGKGSVEFERLAGFIDADGDGKDDRTGRTSGIRRSSDDIDSNIDKPIKPDDDATAIDWLKYLGEYIGYIFEVLINSISNFAKNVVSGVGSVLSLAEPMFGFINQFFSSMPVEIRTAILAMFSVSAFIVIMKMIRG